MNFRKRKIQSLPSSNRRGGFTLIELIIVVAIIITISGVSVPYLQGFMISERLQAVSWQLVQDLKTVKEDAILYQQDLNLYINYNNSPVEPINASNKNNRSYLFETFQWGKDQTVQVEDQHYIPTDAMSSHFVERTLKYGIVIDSITSTAFSPIVFGGKNYFVICFRSGAGSTFRGEGDVVTVMTGRTNITPTIIGTSKLVIKLKDPSSDKAFYVIVEGVGKISMYGSPPS
jgi:type II secretory pathway pseudopilin PulG